MAEQSLALAGAPCRTPAPPTPLVSHTGLEVLTVCFQIAATHGDLGASESGARQVLQTVSPGVHRATRSGGGARGHPGVPVGGHCVSTWSDPPPLPWGKGDLFYLNFLPLPHPRQHFSHLLSLPVSSYEGDFRL